tara:strand:+ start:722 stop:1585 length:864 start_codon:yes stop_codon:yes gene_type:complete
MEQHKPLVWLASYPKSGNTWMRALLTAYFAEQDTLQLNDLIGGSEHLNRELVDDFLGIPSAELTWLEMNNALPDFWCDFAEHLADPHFLKVHSCFQTDAQGMSIFPATVSKAVIQIVRNPLDIALSYAEQFSKSIDEAIEQMAEDYFYHSVGSTHLPERWADWSHNVAGWLDQAEIPVCLIRYEDMQADITGTFGRVLEFCGIEPHAQTLRRACTAAQFDALAAAELASGFHEKSMNQTHFFRSGTAGQWRDVLSKDQVSRITKRHGGVMQRLGYLTLALEFIDRFD